MPMIFTGTGPIPLAKAAGGGEAAEKREATRLDRAPPLVKYSDDQPRDERGQWTSGGGGGDEPGSEPATAPSDKPVRVAQEFLLPGRVPLFLEDPPKTPGFKETIPRRSGKEGVKDTPSWADGMRPRIGENGKDYAKRLLDEKYGRGNWEKEREPLKEYNKLKKSGDRRFRDPKSILVPDDDEA